MLSRAAFFGLFTGTMASTSVRLAIYNLTQVEDINRHGKTHVLAILKPSLQRLAEISVDAASTKTYPEITYPLSMPPYSGNPQNNLPTVKTIRHEHLSEPVPIDVARNMVNATAFRGDAGSQISTAQASQSVRDQQAVRTFAILETVHPGDNPWDLGSALLNWKTVMGDRVIDWSALVLIKSERLFLSFLRMNCVPEAKAREGGGFQLMRNNVRSGNGAISVDVMAIVRERKTKQNCEICGGTLCIPGDVTTAK
ncbi:Palmitoyltransferase PFA5 protein [Rutstroemia sp. NJR-2017a WRK4]|nr:Palmitoyltransferase PFA5 protein [Rutstroemia sp. NJR-2017a WRK4]